MLSAACRAGEVSSVSDRAILYNIAVQHVGVAELVRRRSAKPFSEFIAPCGFESRHQLYEENILSCVKSLESEPSGQASRLESGRR